MEPKHYRIMPDREFAETLGIYPNSPTRLSASPATMVVSYFHDDQGRCLGYVTWGTGPTGDFVRHQCAVAVERAEGEEERFQVWY